MIRAVRSAGTLARLNCALPNAATASTKRPTMAAVTVPPLPSRERVGVRLCALEDVDAAAAIDQVHEATRIERDVVAADALLAARNRGQERRDLARGVRVG